MAAKKKFLLRLDPSIYDSMRKWADDEFRSVNAQIEYILRKALRSSGRLATGDSSAEPGGAESDD